MLRGLDRRHESALQDAVDSDSQPSRELVLHHAGDEDHSFPNVASGRVLYRLPAPKLSLVKRKLSRRNPVGVHQQVLCPEILVPDEKTSEVAQKEKVSEVGIARLRWQRMGQATTVARRDRHDDQCRRGADDRHWLALLELEKLPRLHEDPL